MSLLVADVGGTHTRLGFFVRGADRPSVLVTREYSTAQYGTFGHVLDAFLREVPPDALDAVAIGVAGPVVGQRAQLTNVPWVIDASHLRARLGISSVTLLNDLEAMAWSVQVLSHDELDTLQAGTPHEDGNAVVLAAGTGLGEAYLHRVNGEFHVMASEAGHADFAARTELELEFVRLLTRQVGRVSVEHVISGPGLVNLYRFTHRDGAPCEAGRVPSGPVVAAAVTEAALAGRCPRCTTALDMFAAALGAEAGNLGLRGTATSGVYIGGGIAPKVLPALKAGGFLRAFREKEPMDALVRNMPVHVILHPAPGLLGAAVAAQALVRPR